MSINFVVSTADRIVAVREALEKIHAQGAIGTVNIPRCIAYLKEVEDINRLRADATTDFKRYVLGLDD
jgi:hypothetical protein